MGGMSQAPPPPVPLRRFFHFFFFFPELPKTRLKLLPPSKSAYDAANVLVFGLCELDPNVDSSVVPSEEASPSNCNGFIR